MKNIYDLVQKRNIEHFSNVLHESNKNKLAEFASKQNVGLAIEIGSHIGRSSVHIAKSLKEDSNLLCVDFFESHYYSEFLSHIYEAGVAAKVLHLRSSSLEASKILDFQKTQADLIYIDASHDEINVYDDLNFWFPFLKNDGILCGDDWSWFLGANNLHGWTSESNEFLEKNHNTEFVNEESITLNDTNIFQIHGGNRVSQEFQATYTVRRAVKRFAKEHNLKIMSYGNFWWYQKI